MQSSSAQVFVTGPNILLASPLSTLNALKWPTVPAVDPGLSLGEWGDILGVLYSVQCSGHVTVPQCCFLGCSQACWGMGDKINCLTQSWSSRAKLSEEGQVRTWQFNLFSSILSLGKKTYFSPHPFPRAKIHDWSYNMPSLKSQQLSLNSGAM